MPFYRQDQRNSSVRVLPNRFVDYSSKETHRRCGGGLSAASAYRVYCKRVEREDKSDYTVDHSGSSI